MIIWENSLRELYNKMSAEFTWCERNGTSLGSVTEGITNINWKAIDDTTTWYTNPSSIINAGLNSYTKWNYCTFGGAYTTIANVTFSHYAGTFGPGLSLRCQKSMVVPEDKLPGSTPTRTADNVNTTPYDLSIIGSSVQLFIGPTSPAAIGKLLLNINPGDPNLLYTNYIVTQLQTTTAALPGDTVPITLRVEYDEN